MKQTLRILLSLICCSTVAQHPSMPLIVPPSPDASSLGVYADVPVSKYSGIPNIEIPLYTINAHEFSMHIGLSYYASGVKVAQESSSVGLGWSLNAGGVITREIRRKDDLQGDGFVNAPKVPEQGENIDSYMNMLCMNEWCGYNYYHLTPLDTEPDVFSFNFSGYSGKFMFKQNGEIVLLKPESALKIAYVTGGFEITSPDGIIFRFFESERTRPLTEQSEYRNLQVTGPGWSSPNYSVPPGAYYASSWFLSEISLLNGENITFDYSTGYSKTLAKTNRYTASGQSDIRTRTRSESDNKYLNRISWKSGYINFSSSLREDIYGNPLKIDGLSLYDSNDSLIKSYAFDYSYFNEGLIDISQKHEYWRLKLNSVTELSNIGQEKPPYIFNYTVINGYPYDLPSKKSVSTDFWGYFNGQANLDEYGSPMYLSEYERVFDNAENTYLYYPGADKKCYPEYLQIGILNQIKYPMGNITKFEYEPNSYLNYDAYDYHYTESIVQAKACNYAYCNYWGNPNEFQTTDVKEFYVDHNIFSKKRVFITAFSENFAASFPEPQGSFGNLSKITGENGDVERVISNFGYGGGLTNAEPCTGGGPCYSSGVNKRFYLSSGWYRLTLTPDTDLYAEATITFQDRKEDRERQGAGLRIVKIIDDAKERNFDYQSSNDLTSGILLFKPNYNYWFSNAAPFANVGYAFQNYFYSLGLNINLFQTISLYDNSGNLIPQGELLRYTNNTENFAGGASASTVGYTEVTEKLSDQEGNISSTKSSFLSQSSSPQSPFVPIRPKWSNGLLQSESYFSNAKIVKQTSIAYELDVDAQQSIRALAFSDVYFYFYDVKTEWGKLKSTSTSLNYDSNGLNPVTISTNYFYDNAAHFQLTRTESTNSTGDVFKSKTEYPQDILVPTLAEQDLITKHRLAVPLKTQTFKKQGANPEEKLSSQYMVYNHHKWPGQNLIELVKSSKGSKILEDRIEYHAYYSNGKVKEVSKKDGTMIVYVWGYNEEYPIAKIENATYSQVSSHVSNLNTLSNSDTDRKVDMVNVDGSITKVGKEGDLREGLRNLRNSLPNALVTSYTYDPLIGVTSITDPKGYTIYYEYDDFNRLTSIKNIDGKIIGKNEYHLKVN